MAGLWTDCRLLGKWCRYGHVCTGNRRCRRGRVTCAGDMRGQIEAAMNNVETVLAAGGLSLPNVVRLNFYTTYVDSFVAHYDVIKSCLAAVGCQPSSTLLEVKRLAPPNCSSRSRPLQLSTEVACGAMSILSIRPLPKSPQFCFGAYVELFIRN